MLENLIKFCCLPVLFLARVSLADSNARETIKNTVENLRTTVSTQEKTLSPPELEGKLREIIGPIFDFEEMSKLCLAKNWKTATAEQQKEFVSLFGELLARTYLRKIRENVGQSSFTVLGESELGVKKALVKTHVIYNGDEAAIDYRLREQGGKWRIYDVVIENIGLVSNYRNEFGAIIKKENIDGLLVRLRDKM